LILKLHRELPEPMELGFVVDLVPEGMEKEIKEEFRLHLAGNQVTFRRFAWESIALVPAVTDLPYSCLLLSPSVVFKFG